MSEPSSVRSDGCSVSSCTSSTLSDAVVGPILIARNPVGSKNFIAGVVLLVLPFACLLLFGLVFGLYRLFTVICKCARKREATLESEVAAQEFELQTSAQAELGPSNEEGLPQSEAAKSASALTIRHAIRDPPFAPSTRDPCTGDKASDEPANSSAVCEVAPHLAHAALPSLDATSIVDVAVAVRDSFEDPEPFVSSEEAEQGPPAVTSAPSSLRDRAAVDDGIPAPSASYEVHFMSSN